jgi:hypothetical protein
MVTWSLDLEVMDDLLSYFIVVMRLTIHAGSAGWTRGMETRSNVQYAVKI